MARIVISIGERQNRQSLQREKSEGERDASILRFLFRKSQGLGIPGTVITYRLTGDNEEPILGQIPDMEHVALLFAGGAKMEGVAVRRATAGMAEIVAENSGTRNIRWRTLPYAGTCAMPAFGK